MRFVIFMRLGVALTLSAVGGTAFAAVICPDPPGPGMASEAKVASCASAFQVVEYFETVSGGAECPVENLVAPQPGSATPDEGGDLKDPGMASKEFRTNTICRDQPISAYLVCEVMGTLARCDAYPAEVSPAGNLWHYVDVTASNGSQTILHGSQVEFECPANQSVHVRLTVANGSAVSTASGDLQCDGGVLPPPGYVGAVNVGCANSGLPGYNRVTITPPTQGTVEYYVVDTSSVRYNHGWQRRYSGTSNIALVNVSTESYVRAAACNSGGCGPVVQSGQRAYSYCN